MDWIDVKERLPKYDTAHDMFGATSLPVLVVAWGVVRMGKSHAYRDGKCVFTILNVSGDCTEDVTHWMPLPAAPVITAAENAESESQQSPKKESL